MSTNRKSPSPTARMWGLLWKFAVSRYSKSPFSLYMIAFLHFLQTILYKRMSMITLIVLMNRLVRVHVGRWLGWRGAGLRKLLVLDVCQTTAELYDIKWITYLFRGTGL